MILPEMETIVRAFESSDLGEVHVLIGDIFAEYGYALDLDGVDAYLCDPGRYFRSGGGEFWVVREAGRLIATSAILFHEDSAELKAVYVHTKFRRRGWGRSMIERAIQHAEAAGRVKLFLWSDTQFGDAHRLYEKLGFLRTGIRDFNLPSPFSEYRFERPHNPDRLQH